MIWAHERSGSLGLVFCICFQASEKYKTPLDAYAYAYTHVLQGSGFELEQYSYIRDWLNTIETTPGYIPMAGVNA